jgi:hypothetical protein
LHLGHAAKAFGLTETPTLVATKARKAMSAVAASAEQARKAAAAAAEEAANPDRSGSG